MDAEADVAGAEHLPLPGIVRMFASEMTVASAWIRLLAVDLFAARQVYHDGLKNNIETRHSVSLCLLFCPVGILAHVVTKIEEGRQQLQQVTVAWSVETAGATNV